MLFPAEEAQLTPLLRLGAGACAGIIAMSATYPMDMVRGRLTVQVPGLLSSETYNLEGNMFVEEFSWLVLYPILWEFLGATIPLY